MKIRNWLMALCAIIIAPMVFAGCIDKDGNRIYVSFVDVAEESQQVSMALESGNTYQLIYTVMPIEAADKRVKFESSDTNVATVDANGVVTAVSVGEATISIIPLDNTVARVGLAKIKVLSSKEKLSAPTGLTYDSGNKKLVWNEVVLQDSNFKPSYRLNLNIDGVNTQVVTASPSYNLIEFNKRYTVSVSAIGNDTMYESSNNSNTISFVQLGDLNSMNLIATGNAESGDRVYYLQFDLLNFTDSISDYTVDIRNTTGGVLSAQERALWNEALKPENVVIQNRVATIKVPSGLVSTTFSVRLCANSNIADSVYGSEYSDAIKFSKLPAPTNLNLSNTSTSQQLTWSTVQNASKYKILIEYLLNNGDTLRKTVIVDASSTAPTIFDFANLENKPEEGAYTGFDIYMYAIGSDAPVSGIRYLDSSISDLPAKQQLEAVQNIVITKDIDNKQYIISWSEVSNAATYKLYICPSDETNIEQDILDTDRLVYYGNALSYTIGFNQTFGDGVNQKSLWEVGRNYLKIVACPAGESKYTQSVPKLHSESFIKLNKPTNFKVSQGELVWDAVDGANKYYIDFGNGASVLPSVDAIEGVKTYSYEPTKLDMPTSATYYVTIYAVNTDVSLFIDSENSDMIDISRYATPTNLRVENGQLMWSMIDAINGLPINTNTVEVKISNRNGDEVVPVFTTQGAVGIESVLQNISSSDKYFVIQIRAINAEKEGYRYINGDWTSAISTYQLPTPTNVRISNGVISWDAFSDPNIDPMHKGIRYALQVGSQEYGVLADPILDINATSAVIKGLTPNSVTYSVKLKVVIDATKSGEFGTTIKGSTDVYIINSNFSKSFNVRQLSAPGDVSIQESTLYWSPSNQSLNQYRVELYKLNVDNNIRTRATTPTLSVVVTPNDPLNPCFDFSLALGTMGDTTEYDFSAGAYQFVVYAVGTENYTATSSGNFGYLTSYNSNYIEIYKLATPVLDVDNGYVKWRAVYNEISGAQQRVTKYILSVSRNTSEGLVTQTIIVQDQLSTNFNDAYKLPAEFSGPQLLISIQAVSSWPRVFNSEMSAPYKKPSDALPESRDFVVFKQTKVQTDTAHVRVNGSSLIWTDTTANNKQFEVQFYELGGNNPLRDSATLDDYEYTLPDVSGGKYFVTIMRRGYVNSENYSRYLDSEYSDRIMLEKFYKPIGLSMQRDSLTNNPIIYWSATSTSSIMRFKINITHISNGTTVDKTYYMPYTANSLDLYGKAYDEEGNEVDIDEFEPGTLRITIQAVKARQNVGSGNSVLLNYYTNSDGNLVYLVDSAESAILNAYIYSAPKITFKDGLIYLNKTNQFDKGIQMIFTPLDYNAESGNYALNNSEQVLISLASGVDTFDMKKQLQSGIKYHVQLRALGNSNNIIASKWETSEYVIERLLPMNANTVNAPIEQANTFDGWYVKNGMIYWSAVEGVTQYLGQITDSLGVERNVFTISADDTTTTYYSGINNVDYGTYKLQFTLVGGATDKTLTLNDDTTFKMGFVSSDLSTAQDVIKLYAPNDYNIDGRSEAYMRISNGEFDWGLRDAGTDAWIDSDGVTAYRVEIDKVNNIDIPTTFETGEGSSEAIFNVGSDSTAQYFDAKSYLFEAGQYNIKIYSIGNTWTGINDANKIYLTSDTFGEFTLINGGQIDDLAIRSGMLQWSAASNGSTAGYDVTYETEGDIQRIQHISSNAYSFDDLPETKGLRINNIMVRHSGDKSTIKGAYSGHINTNWSASMTNIVKLPDIAKSTTASGTQKDMYINEWGQLAWTYGAQYLDGGIYSDVSLKMHLYLDITYLGVKVGGYSDGWDIDKPQQYFDVPTINVPQDQIDQAVPGATEKGILKYVISGYVLGTQEEVFASAAGGQRLYLNSNTYTHDAYKIGDPTSFELDEINGPGLRLNWDISNCNVSGYEPEIQAEKIVNGDLVLFTYLKNGSQELQHKVITSEQIDQIPLWEVAYFDEIRLTVLNSEGDAFASSTLRLNQISFKYFFGGEGTRENPFVIKSNETYTAEQQLGLIYWLPELYFELGENIKLTDLSVIQSTINSSATINFPIPESINATDVDDIYKKLELTGGINGKNYTISNVQTIGATDFGWWNSIMGSTIDENSDEYIIDDVFLNKKGIILDINMLAYEINLTNIAENSYNGMYVKQNYGWIVDCTIDGASRDDRHDAENNYIPVVQGKINASNVYFGGIAGYVGKKEILEGGNQTGIYVGEGNIQNCTNYLDISMETLNELSYETYVGGIAGINYSGTIINCTNGAENMTQRDNRAEILGYYSGGIVGKIDGTIISTETSTIYDYPYVVGCVNYGKITSNLRETGDTVKSAGGGIVGLIKRGFVTYSINFGTITTQGVGAALGGIVGSQDPGSYTLCCINVGNIEFNTYYNLTALIKTNVAAGGLIGLGAGGSLYNSWTISYSVKEYDESTHSTISRDYSYGRDDGMSTPQNISTITAFTNMTQDEINQLLNDPVKSVNQVIVSPNNQDVYCVYARYDGLYPRFDCNLGENPRITWVSMDLSS